MNLSPLTNRLFARGDRLSQYGDLLDRLGALIRSAEDLNVFLGKVTEEVGGALELAHVIILLRSNERMLGAGNYFSLDLSYGSREQLRLIDGEIMRGMADDDSLIELTEKELVSKLYATAEHSPDVSADELSVKTAMAIPLRVDEATRGAILLYRGKSRRWTDAERFVARTLGSSLVLAIDHIQSKDRAEIAAGREALTNRLLTAIRSSTSVDDIMKVAVESLGATLRVTRSVIYFHAAPESIERAVATGPALMARSEYRASVLIPSLLNTPLDLTGTPLMARLLAGEIITIPDINESDLIIRAIGARLGLRALALAPIAYSGQMVGALALEQFDSPRDFTDEEVRLIGLVAEQTAVAACQAELYREAQESARREALISKISAAIHGSLDPEAVMEAIVNEVGTALRVCRVRFALLPHPLPEMLPLTHEYVASCCANRPPVLDRIQVRDNSFLQTVLASDGPIVVSNPMSDPRFASIRNRVEAGSVKSIMTMAIRIGGKPIGIFSLHHCEKRHAWSDWEVDVVRSVAEQAAVAIRQAELHREVRDAALRAALANQIVASIRRSLDLGEILQVAVEELGRALGASRTYFRKLLGGENALVAEYLSDPSLSLRDVRAPAGNYITTRVMQTRRTLVIDDVQSFIDAHPDLASTVAAWQVQPKNLSQIVCPVFVDGEYWGGLSISQTDRARKWTSSEIALIEMVAAQVEVAVTHSRLFDEARRAAEVQALIGQIVQGINQSNHLDEIFPIVARELGEHLATDSLLIMKLDQETDEWRIECAFSNGKVKRPARTYSAEDFRTFSPLMEGGEILCHDADNDPRVLPYLDRFLRPVGTRAFMAVRLCYEDQPRLVIVAIMKTAPRRWTRDDAEVIRAAASQVFVALQRAELFEMISHGKYEWESTFDALSDGIFIFDGQGLLRRVNRAGAAFEGADIRDMIGRRCCTLLQGIESEHCRVAEVMKTGRPVTFELEPEKLKRPVLVTMSPLRNGSGRLFEGDGDSPPAAQGAVCIVRELSELRAAEAVAREQRGFLVKLIEHANDAIFALSPEGRVVWLNEQLAAQSGYSREELLGKGSWLLLPEGDRAAAVERFTRALGGEAQTFEMRGLKKNGESRLLLITYTPIYDEGRVTSVLSIARDITEERVASERAAQAEKLRALGQLATGVAHNFNNILAAILGHAQLIKRDFGDERLVNGLDIIERAALDGAQTVRRIQSFGLQHNESSDVAFDINQVVQDSATLTRARWCDEAQARGLQYAVELDLRSVNEARGSASELREVFVNIILNALDAMPQGGRLRIATEDKGRSVVVNFTDNGVGMSRDVSEHVFEPFFTTKGASGVGLGLAVSYSIVERHGGRIEVKSYPGHGTTFTVTLPAAGRGGQEPSPGNAATVSAASVLVVDDDDRVRSALVGMLKSAGHSTEHAASGREALLKMERNQFELVFTDLSMPEMDGWAVASEIRRRWPTVKVVLITGYNLPPEAIDQKRDLVHEVIFKPIRFDDISATLNNVLA